MRPRTTAFLVIAPLILLLALVATGQPAGKADTESTSKEAKEETTEEQAEPLDAGSVAIPDVGPAPPTIARRDSGPKSSPLNPRPNEFPDGSAGAPPPEFDKILGDIAALRARVAALTTTMFASKLRVIVQTDDAEYARIQSFVVTLDDGVVFRAPPKFTAEDEKTVFEHAVAPGHHVIGVEIERTDARNRAYKTYQATKLSVIVPEGKHLEAHVEVEEDSDMAEDFPDDEDGEYDLRVQMRARVISD